MSNLKQTFAPANLVDKNNPNMTGTFAPANLIDRTSPEEEGFNHY